ncbi:trypsin-like serine protease [Psychromonas antarctica]|uniref:trypsin-like serine protease n=1 Tax=Psychromonas antarctica TaxID=67573 RepID=UPI001EE90F29|nr:trypsin-like serine protease [Psychromonas antarctica]MCG6202065.1 trypsin-like serine protease [Psychromonas antarctica]
MKSPLLAITLLLVSVPALCSTTESTFVNNIVGGSESLNQQQWPSVVSLKYKSYIYGDSHFCGGSLIAPQWVITAAHCMYNDSDQKIQASLISATVGEYELSSQPITLATNIEQIFTHPDYDPKDREKEDSDIALLKLSKPVTNITLPLASLSQTVSWIDLGIPATVIGWGSTVAVTVDGSDIVDPAYPDVLREVVVPINSDQQCFESLGSTYTENMLCAGEPDGGKDSCQGDSGGPLMVYSNTGWQQVGIVSWGYGCAAPGYPGVYTRIGAFSDWIHMVTSTFWVTTNSTFYTSSIGDSDIQLISVENNTASTAYFTYNFTGSDSFTFDASECSSIDAYSSCQFSVTYTPSEERLQSAVITVSSTIDSSIPQQSSLVGSVVSEEEVQRSSGSMGLWVFLLLPLIAVRRILCH